MSDGQMVQGMHIYFLIRDREEVPTSNETVQTAPNVLLSGRFWHRFVITIVELLIVKSLVH